MHYELTFTPMWPGSRDMLMRGPALPEIAYEAHFTPFAGASIATGHDATDLHGAALIQLRQTQAFRDAVDGISLLRSWSTDDYAAEFINEAAFGAEVRRAIRAANAVAASCYLGRERGTWGTADNMICDGEVIRELLAGCKLLGDWVFVPALIEASAEPLWTF